MREVSDNVIFKIRSENDVLNGISEFYHQAESLTYVAVEIQTRSDAERCPKAEDMQSYFDSVDLNPFQSRAFGPNWNLNCVAKKGE